jgi:regulator of replication initiation timing
MDETKVFELLINIHKEIGVIKSDISKIETDLKEHMRRTAVAEDRIEATERQLGKKIASLQKAHYMVQGALAFIGLIGVIAAIYNHLI